MRIIMLALMMLLPNISHAEISRFRISALAGFGESNVTEPKHGSDSQGPIGTTITMDYMVDGQWTLSTEHQRTISDRSGSAVGMTGFSLKNYFRNSQPLAKFDTSVVESKSRIEPMALSPYGGVAVGISQASILDKKLNAVGFFISGKLGADWPMNRTWGLRTEGTMAVNIGGSGSIDFTSLQFGAYIFL